MPLIFLPKHLVNRKKRLNFASQNGRDRDTKTKKILHGALVQ